MPAQSVTDYETFPAVFARKHNQRDLDGIAGVKFKLIEFLRASVSHEWDTCGKPRTDAFHHINFVCEGRGEVWSDRHRVVLEPGNVYWLPDHTPLHAQLHEPLHVYFLRMRCEWLAGLDVFWNWHQPLCLGPWDPAHFLPQWQESPLSGGAYWELLGFLYRAFASQYSLLADHIQRQFSLHSAFGKSFDLIDRRLSAILQVAELAKAHGTTLAAFTRLFRRHFGVAPKAYLNRRLNQEACELILSTDLPVREVACRLKFTDEYYFNRFFSKMNGIPPRRYRRSALGRSTMR